MDENNTPGGDKNKIPNDENNNRVDFDSFKLDADSRDEGNLDEPEMPPESIDDSFDGDADSFGSSKKIDVVFSSPEVPESDKGEVINLKDSSEKAESKTPASDGLVDTEIEPSTVATPMEQGGSTLDKELKDEASVEAEPSTVATGPPSLAVAPSSRISDKKRLIIIASAAVAAILVVALAWMLSTRGVKEDTSQNNTAVEQPAPVEAPKLNLGVTSIDGTVELMRGETAWQPLEVGSQIQEGDTVRTGDSSRAVLALENGALARLDENTTVLIKSLATDLVEIENVEGRVYSRVVPGEGKYQVQMSDVAYEALGTSFITFKSLGENGVQVFHGSVRVDGVDENIAEGQQYHRASNDVSLAGKVSELDIDKLTDDEFIAWNRTEDEKNPALADSLGVLTKIKERGEEIEREEQEKAQLEEERKRQAAEQAERERREAEEREARENEEDDDEEGDSEDE